MKNVYTNFCKIHKIQHSLFWIGMILITFLSIGSVGAQELYFYSGGRKIPLKEDRSSTIIQFKENANVQRTVASMRSSQSLEKIEVQPTKKRAILKFDASQNVNARQLNTSYFRTTGEIESSAFAFQVEGGMQLWPTNKVLLKFKPGKSLSDLQQLMKQYRATYLKTDHEMVILKVSDMQNTLTLSNLIYESGLVAWAHPDFYAEIQHADNANLDNKAISPSYNPLYAMRDNPSPQEVDVFDTYFSDQFQMHNTGQLINGVPGLNDADCNALEAWDITTGADIIVAVVDDGVEEHEDLGNVIDGFTPARPTENGRPGNNPAGLNEHGQSCAGIIAALHNGIGVMGVAPKVKIQPINIFTREEDASDNAAAYTWAADNGAHVISNSWGYIFTPCNFKIDAIDAAIEYAVTQGRGGKGSIVVFSSGNDGNDCVSYPASNPNVIAVGAFGNNGVITDYSNKGSALDLVAGSGNGAAGVTTIDRTGAAGYNNGSSPNDYPNDNYTNTFGGTSAACPVVSGVVALVLSINPNLTDAQVKNILYFSAIDMGTPGRDDTYGRGRVNAYGAVQVALTPWENSPPIAQFQADPISGTSPLTVNFDASGSTDADNHELTYFWDFGDGSFGTGKVTSHVYSKLGMYKPILTVDDGAQTSRAEGEINVVCPGDNIAVEFYLFEDYFFGDVSWEFKNKDGSVIKSGAGADDFPMKFCLPAGCFDLVIRDSSTIRFPFGDVMGGYKLIQGGLVLAQGNVTYEANEIIEICPDVEKPMISDCPTDITISNDPDSCEAAVTWTAPTASDDKGTVSLTSNFEPGAVFLVGTTEVTYTATDVAGNQSTCSFKVTVEDTEDPIISCPANVSETVAFGVPGKVIAYAAPTFSDNCTGASIELKAGLASGAIFPVGVTTVTYLATDATGNSAECSFTVTITQDPDAIDPIISACPTDITVSNDAGDCSAAVSWTAPTATDNSGSVDFIGNFEPGAVFPVGTTKVTYTATDAAGNQVTCSFDVTVADDELPVIGTVSDISVTVPSGQTVTSVSVPQPLVSDNCSATVTGVRNDGKPLTDPFGLGETTITWSAEDPSGNDAVVVTQRVKVTQSAPPLSITSFTLINAGTDVEMFALTDGMQISQSQVQGLSLNIRANTNPSVVGSVVLTLSGPVNRTITENVAPYALFGDNKGNYAGRTLPVGTYTLTARAHSASNRGGTAGTISSIRFSIVVPVTGVAVSPSAATLGVGSTVRLTATVLPTNASNKAVTWSSSDASVASVDANGLVTGHATGQVSITATTANGGFSAAATITVQAIPNLGIGSFTLVNAATDADMFTLTDGMQISQSQVQGLSLNIRANTNPSVVGSVFMTLSGPLKLTITENVAPYALFGDSNGNYAGRTLPVGTYTLTARAHSLSGRRGMAGVQRTITFSIVSSAFRIANEGGNTPIEAMEQEGPSMEAQGEFTLKAFPNPVKDGRVSIADSRFQEGTVKYVLYSINGTKLTEGQAEIGAGKTIRLDFSGPVKQAGMYILILDYDRYLVPQRVQLVFE